MARCRAHSVLLGPKPSGQACSRAPTFTHSTRVALGRCLPTRPRPAVAYHSSRWSATSLGRRTADAHQALPSNTHHLNAWLATPRVPVSRLKRLGGVSQPNNHLVGSAQDCRWIEVKTWSDNDHHREDGDRQRDHPQTQPNTLGRGEFPVTDRVLYESVRSHR